MTDDRRSGSSEVARSFLQELEKWIAVDRSTSGPQFRTSLIEHLRAAQRSQPSMALVHQLATRALEVADTGVRRGDGAVELRAHLTGSCTAERDDLAKAELDAALWATRLLSGTQTWIATLSASGAVREALLRAQADRRGPHAIVAEGRPHFEGRDLAATLGAAGIPTWLVVDAALPLLLSQTTMVWIGADAVTDRGVINKVGSLAAALAAREASVPIYALATRRKFLPASTAALRIDEMAPEEVWAQAPESVRPRNVYFEMVPLELFRGIVVEDGVLATTEAAALARERPIAGELAAALPA